MRILYNMTDALRQKLKTLPACPGVYFHKNAQGEVIYVGKAAVLKNRVRQYFQESRSKDAKTQALVAEIVDTDWIEVESEIDALFLESEMVKRYKPQYNVLLRDDRSQTYVRITLKDEWPTVTTTRHPGDDGAEYIGPFYNGYAVKKALRYLRRVFPFFIKTPEKMGSKLEMQIGLNPDTQQGNELYRDNLRQLMGYLRGNRKALARDIESQMKQAAREERFEEAARLRNRLRHMRELQTRVMFGDREFLDISKDRALADLAQLLTLGNAPARIEGYDVSHMGGTNVVASMVVFTNGASDRAEYRKFKTKIDKNDDFYNMNETIGRRLSPRNIKSWGIPDLLLIDGGKGQLDAALKARDACGQVIPCVGLAKKREQIVVDLVRSNATIDNEMVQTLNGYVEYTERFALITLPHETHIVKLLQRIRDESHRFAVSYHTTLKRKKQTQGALEEVPGIGLVSKKALLNAFGSVRGVARASEQDVARIVGEARAKKIKQYIHEEK